MLNIQNVALTRGTKVLFTNANFTVFPKQKMGLVGRNGCGKSSLLAAIQGELEPSAGNIELQKDIRVAHIRQETPALDISALDYVLQGDEVLAAIFAELRKAEQADDGEKMMQLHCRLADLDGYSAQARAAKILHGLGVSDADCQKLVAKFSGGWRMRLNLAQCLMQPSDLLLLDEPTNHLDLETIAWLENWLQQYPGSILVISHDRDFLDGLVTHVMHFDQGSIKIYNGNYTSFERQRAEALALQEAQYRKQQTQIAHLQKFVDRFRYKASKAKQAQSRLKMIERMDKVAAVQVESGVNFEFFEPGNAPNPLVRLSRANIGYDEHQVLQQVSISVANGARIGLLGVNGAGKSTLIKAMVGALKVQGGQCEQFTGVKIGYFAQHQVDELELDATPLEHFNDLPPKGDLKALKRYLGSFAFDYEKSQMPVKTFSGGEKSRLALAMLIWQRPNLLLLDEPTNHLDMEVRNALLLALQSYSGAMVLVSHDRFLLRSLVDELYIIQTGRLHEYQGDVRDYLA